MHVVQSREESKARRLGERKEEKGMQVGKEGLL
jgi:hypothetical protein